MTRSEKLLWYKLRKSQLNGLKFRRQYGVFNYVVDFYCPEYKLAIEIIGDVHGYQSRERFDEMRAKRIETLGIKILTYTNVQVQEEMEGVQRHTFQPPPAPLLHKKGESCHQINTPFRSNIIVTGLIGRCYTSFP